MDWLSHHPPEQHQRAWNLSGTRVCARCLGLYPAMCVAMAVMWTLGGPGKIPADPWLVLGLGLPSALDWAQGTADPGGGSNLRRTAVGALQGLAMARAAYLLSRRPLDAGIWAALGGLLLVAALAAVAFRRGRAP